MEFPLGKLLRKVKQIVVSHLALVLIYFLSSEVPGYRAMFRGEGSGMARQILFISSAHIFLDEDLVVEFTDDEDDEIF